MQHSEIDGGRPFDWGRASDHYARYRDIYPPAFYQRILDLGLCEEGQAVLDLGTGTGVLPRNLYRYGARFTGVDASPEQIAQARRLSEEQGMDIEYRVCPAEAIDFAPDSFDVVLACQCFFYFDTEILVPKLLNVLRPGGRFCELTMSWLPGESEIAAGSESLVLRYNPHWSGRDYRRPELTPPPWAEGRFDVVCCAGYDLPVRFTRDSWHGRMLSCRGIGASGLSQAALEDFEREHRAWLREQPEEFDIPHHMTVLCLRKL